MRHRDGHARTAGTLRLSRGIAIASASLYLATLVAAPLIDPHLDPLRSYPEDYSPGPADWVVRLGYVSVALMALAIAVVSLRQGGWPPRIAAVLLVAGAIASATLAIAPQQVTGGPLLAGIAGLVIAPLAISMSARRELAWPVVMLGFLVTFGFVALAVAPRDVAGITNRGCDVLLALWGLAYAIARDEARDAPLGVWTPGG